MMVISKLAALLSFKWRVNYKQYLADLNDAFTQGLIQGRKEGVAKAAELHRALLEAREQVTQLVSLIDLLKAERSMTKPEASPLPTEANINLRVTPDMVEGAIAREDVYVVPGTTTTLVTLILTNGFTVVGESACADPAIYDYDLGVKYAREDAISRLYAFEAYRLMSAFNCK